jgi:hypothetical protein
MKQYEIVRSTKRKSPYNYGIYLGEIPNDPGKSVALFGCLTVITETDDLVVMSKEEVIAWRDAWRDENKKDEKPIKPMKSFWVWLFDWR